MQKPAKLLTVGGYSGGSVTAYPDGGTTLSGYIGHDWTDDIGPETIGPETIGLDTRPVNDPDRISLAIAGPMPGVDLPPNTRYQPFTDGHETYTGEAKALDYVSVDVYVKLWEAKGAIVHRTPDAVKAFAAELSRNRYAK